MCYLEDTSFDIIQPEEQKEIRINNEQRSMDTSQYQDRHNGGVPEEAEKAMAPHSSTLTWKIPWTEEPGRLQSRGSLRVGHD